MLGNFKECIIKENIKNECKCIPPWERSDIHESVGQEKTKACHWKILAEACCEAMWYNEKGPGCGEIKPVPWPNSASASSVLGKRPPSVALLYIRSIICESRPSPSRGSCEDGHEHEVMGNQLSVVQGV